MKGGLRDESVIVFFGEASGAVEGAGDDADGLKLGAGIADGILVNGKSLGEELVAEFFEACLIGYFTAHYE